MRRRNRQVRRGEDGYLGVQHAFAVNRSIASLFAILVFASLMAFWVPAAWGQGKRAAKKNIPEVHINEDGFTASSECGKCHEGIYQTWKNSLHSMSISDPVFWTAYLKTHYNDKKTALETCLSCHAPMVRFNGDFELSQPLTREGIGCDFCHSISEVREKEGRYVYSHDPGLLKQGPLKDVESPVHDTKYNELYKQSLFCAGCHEYQTPDGVKIFETYSEWKEGPYAAKGVQCQDCHMGKVKGGIVKEGIIDKPGTQFDTHDIAGGHSLTRRKQSVGLKIKSVKRLKRRVTVTVEVTNKGAGHKIPTGLPTKKFTLQVSVRPQGSEGELVKQRIYQKTLVNENGVVIKDDSEIMSGKPRMVMSDNRIAPLEKREEVFVFFVPANKAVKVTASMYYSYSPQIIQTSPIHTKIGEVSEYLAK